MIPPTQAGLSPFGEMSRQWVTGRVPVTHVRRVSQEASPEEMRRPWNPWDLRFVNLS